MKKTDFENVVINFDHFTLPFTNLSEDEDNDFFSDEEDSDNDEIKERMESMIPKEAIYLGSIDSSIENWTDWIIHDEYYIIPITDEDFNWALFRISWDDNWGNWDWSFDARLKGFEKSYIEASKFMLKRFWDNCQIDLSEKTMNPYLQLLNGI